MRQTPLFTKSEQNDSKTDRHFRRRHFLALGSSVGATLIAGCSTETESPTPTGSSTPSDDSNTTSGGPEGTTATPGSFRLLISDQPVAIDEFDELNVSFDRARIFRGETAEDDEPEETTNSPVTTESETVTETETTTATATPTNTATPTVTETTTETESETQDGESTDDDQRGFFILDLGGATVDLTQVVGEKAISVFDGELAESRYTKIELYAANVEGIVDGEPAEVTIPSGKLQITKPFEIVADKTLSFVFDINVVKKGKTGKYNLLPVISESGVAGQDVEVDEIKNRKSNSERNKRSETGEGTDQEETETSESENGSDKSEDNGQSDDANAG